MNQPRTIECPVKLSKNGYAITSPRTGRTLTLPSDRLADLPRVRGRIAQAASCGKHVATFTPDELRAVKAAADRIETPSPAVPFDFTTPDERITVEFRVLDRQCTSAATWCISRAHGGPNGNYPVAFLPRDQVTWLATGKLFGCGRFSMPVWLYRRVMKVL